MLSHRARLLSLLALMGTFPLLAGSVEPTTPAMPSIQRVFLTPDRLATELARFPGETWKRLPRAEFEKRLSQGRAATTQGTSAPRLVGARWIAMVQNEDLIGVARWDIVCPEGPGILPLQGPGGAFNLALRRAPKEGDREVLLAEVDARGPALLLEQAGSHTVDLAWSSRLERTADGLTMELRGPASPSGLLELYLPSDWGISGPASILHTGPLPLPPVAERGDLDVPANFSRWRVFGLGRGALRLNLHPAGDTSPPLALVQRWVARHRLAPEGVATTLETALDLLPRDASEVVLEWDSTLRPYSVAVSPVVPDGPVPELANWTLTPPGDGKVALLTIQMRRPVPEVVVVVKALAPLTGKAGPGGSVEWTAPEVRVVRGVPRAETIELLFHPDLRVDNWQVGDYRPIETDTVTETEGELSFSRLTLSGGGLRPDNRRAPRQPSVRVHTTGVEFRARPVVWWRVHPTRSVLQATIGLEVQQGRLFDFPVHIPSGWEVERVEVEPAALGGRWGLRRDRGKSTIQVELQTPLTPGSPSLGAEGATVRSQARVRVRLRSSQASLPLGKALSFPELQVGGARFREGTLGIHLEGQLLDARAASQLGSPEFDEDAPWGRDVPEFLYGYRQQPLTGNLTLRLRPPQLSGRALTDVYLAPGVATVETRLRLHVEAGAPVEVDLLMPGDSVPDWTWQTASSNLQMRRVERLPGSEFAGVLAGLGGPSLSTVASLFLPQPVRYRLTLNRPLRPQESVELLAQTRLSVKGGSWNVPVPTLLQAERVEGDVAVHLAGIELGQVEAEGLRELSASPQSRGHGSWRRFQTTEGPVRLLLQSREPAPERLAEAHVRLTAWPTEHGVRVHYRVLIGDWTQETLPVRLPVGAELLALRVDGRAILARVDEEGRLSLPIPVRSESRLPWLCFEFLYELRGTSGVLWQTLSASAPVLPLEATTFRQIWRLPPQTVPAFPWQALRCPGAGDGINPPSLRIHPADLFRLIPWPRRWLEVFDSPEKPPVPLGLTLALVPSRPGQEVNLREMFELLAQGAVREQGQMIVDASAWRESRLRFEDRVRLSANPAEGDPIWESVGLALVSCPEGWLLTTCRQRDQWFLGGVRTLPQAVAAACEEANQEGYDRSGRFRVLEDWLPAALRSERLGEDLQGESLLPADLENPGWSSWEVPSDASGDLVVVRRETVATGGVLLAFVGGLIWVALRRGSRWRRNLGLILGLALSGLALFWLPTPLQPLAWYPLVLGGLLVLFAYLRRLRKAAGLGGSPSVATVPPALFVAVLLGLVARYGHATQDEEQQPPDVSKTVLVVGQPDEGQERQTAWVPASLLDHLDQMANPGVGWPEDGAVLTAVRCTGKPVDGVGEFTAQFEIFSFSEKPQSFVVPLEDVVLQKPAWLDDAVIKPVALPRPQRGYAIRLEGMGRHRLELAFRVPVQSAGPGEQSVQFTLPKLLKSQLQMTIPGASVAGQVLGRLGAGQSRTEAQQAIVEADLGRMPGAVQVRWTSSSMPQQPAKVRYQEAYLWELRLEESTLTGVLQYSIEKGNIRELTLDVPEALVVRGVTATRSGGGEARLQGFRIREHPERDSSRRQELIVRFQSPLSGDLLLRLDLIPRGPLPLNVELTLPSPRGEQVGGALAYRLEGLQARPLNLLRLTGIQRERFAPFWPAASRPETKQLAFAATFTRPGGAGPELRLRLTPQSAPVQVEQDLALRFGMLQADLRATLDVSTTDSDLALLEWEMLGPQPTIASVRGVGLRRWSQQANRLLVWLERVPSTRLEVEGWLTLSREARKPPSLDLPRLRLASEGKQSTRLRLLAQPGLVLKPQQLTGLQPINEGTVATLESVYQAGESYTGQVQIERGGGRATAQIATLVEVVERQILFQTQVTCRIPQGELRSLSLTLRGGWEGAAVTLDANRVAQRRERINANGTRTWTLDLQPGITREYSLTMSGTRPMTTEFAPLTMPDIVLGGVQPTETWLVVVGAELQARAESGVEPQPALPEDLPTTFRGPERLRRAGGAVWRVKSSPWDLRLTPSTPMREAGQPVQVLLSERNTRNSGPNRWLHEARLWIRCDEQPELSVQFAGAVKVLSVALSGVELDPVQPTPDRLWVPLPGQSGVLLLRVRWEYTSGNETLAEPSLEPLRFEGATVSGRTLWRLNLPAGWEVNPETELQSGPGPRARAHLAQAEAALTMAAQLGELAREHGTPTGLELATQHRFYLHLRKGELLLERHPAANQTLAPDGTSLSEWAVRLADQNRDQARPTRFDYEEARSEADRQVKAGISTSGATTSPEHPVLTERIQSMGHGRLASVAAVDSPQGTPLLGWTSGDVGPTVGAILPAWRRSVQQASTTSLVWVGLVLIAALMSQSDYLVRRLRAFLPEQLVIAGGLGYLIVGWTPVVVGLLAVGVLARGLMLVRRLWPRTARR